LSKILGDWINYKKIKRFALFLLASIYRMPASNIVISILLYNTSFLDNEQSILQHRDDQTRTCNHAWKLPTEWKYDIKVEIHVSADFWMCLNVLFTLLSLRRRGDFLYLTYFSCIKESISSWSSYVEFKLSSSILITRVQATHFHNHYGLHSTPLPPC